MAANTVALPSRARRPPLLASCCITRGTPPRRPRRAPPSPPRPRSHLNASTRRRLNTQPPQHTPPHPYAPSKHAHTRRLNTHYPDLRRHPDYEAAPTHCHLNTRRHLNTHHLNTGARAGSTCAHTPIASSPPQHAATGSTQAQILPQLTLARRLNTCPRTRTTHALSQHVGTGQQ
jgi:hypothetical protein